MISLNLYQRLARGSAHYANITRYAPDWQRSTRAIGGYMTGGFTAQNVTRDEMIDWYDRYLGCRIVESTYGMTSWEGLIYEMRLVLDGVEYTRTLSPEWWHNKVWVVYSSSAGARAETATAENTDSSDEFGEMNYLISLGGATSAGATALRDRHLKEFAWPRSRMTGTIDLGGAATARENSLEVSCAGYWATLNWRYTTSSLAAFSADTQINTLVPLSEFITAGRVETNALSVSFSVSTASRLGDLIADVIAQGDADGNVWQGGVYDGRKFVYEQAPTTVSHYLRNSELVTAGGMPVVPSLVLPGILLQNGAAPSGSQPAGTSSAWDDPRVAYVEEVVFQVPDRLQLKLSGQEDSRVLLSLKLFNNDLRNAERAERDRREMQDAERAERDRRNNRSIL